VPTTTTTTTTTQPCFAWNLVQDRSDEGCDGPPYSNCTIYTYDYRGNMLTRQRDYDCNGWPEACATFAYNSRGDMITREEDDGCDGYPDYCQTWTYDASGNMLTDETDSDCNGQPETCQTFTYSGGNVRSKLYDNGCNGCQFGQSYRILYSYDSGNLFREEMDFHCDGVDTYCTYFTYDADGNKLTTGIDDDCLGYGYYQYQSCHTYTYDTAGNMLTEQHDSDCDGTPDSNCTTWTYDADGNMLTKEYDYYCNGLGGSSDYCCAWTYDAHGNMLTRQYDPGCYGTPDYCTTFEYECR